jgi:hypothetical protein
MENSFSILKFPYQKGYQEGNKEQASIRDSILVLKPAAKKKTF